MQSGELQQKLIHSSLYLAPNQHQRRIKCCLSPLGKMWFEYNPRFSLTKKKQNKPKQVRLAVISPSVPILRLCNRVLAASVSLRICVLSSVAVLLIVSTSAFGANLIQRAPRYVRAALWHRRHRWKLLMLAAGCDAQTQAPCAPVTLHAAHTVPSPAYLEIWHHSPGCSDRGWSPGRSIPQRAWRLLKMTHGDLWLKGGR